MVLLLAASTSPSAQEDHGELIQNVWADLGLVFFLSE